MTAAISAKKEPPRRYGRAGRKSDGPNPVDIHVGGRVRLRRTLLGMSQEKLAKALGLTFQQVQKYERGTNRIGASRLHELSQALDVPVAFFFDDLDAGSGAAPAFTGGYLHEDAAPPFEGDPMGKRETLQLVRAYYRIKSRAVRKRILDLARSLADDKEADED
ncbi:MAG: helix-turn-helix transcriptional regulator [Pseudomonadota bacterium]